jgi:hypothetical protein
MHFFWQESSKAEQDVSRPEQDGTSMNGNTGTAISSGAAPPDTGESDDQGPPSTKEKIEKLCNDENIADADQLKTDHNEGADFNAAKPKKKAALDSDKSTKNEDLSTPTNCEAIVDSDADTKKGDLVASAEGTNGAADDASRPADSTPTKPKRGRPPGPKSSQKKAAGKDQSSGLDLKKVEEAGDSAAKLAKRSAKDEKSSAKKAGEGESSKKTQKNNSKQQKDETLSEDDPAKDLIIKVFLSLNTSRFCVELSIWSAFCS